MSPKGCLLTSQLPCKGYWNYLSAMKTQQYKEISWAADTLEYWMVLRPEPLSPQGSPSQATWVTYCWWELFPAFLHSLPWQRPYPTQDHAPKKFKLAWQNSTLFSVLIPVLISCGSTWFTPATSLDWEKLSINAAKRSHKDDAMWWVKMMGMDLKLGVIVELKLYHSLSEEFLSVLMEKAIHWHYRSQFS